MRKILEWLNKRFNHVTVDDFIIFIVENNFNYHKGREKWYSTKMRYNSLKDGNFTTIYYTDNQLKKLICGEHY